MRRVGKAQAERLALYAKLKPAYFKDHPICEMPNCNSPSCDIHHKKKPRKTYLNNLDTWMALCRPCHNQIENNKTWARENGYLENI